MSEPDIASDISPGQETLALKSERVLVGGQLQPALVLLRGEQVEAVLPHTTELGAGYQVRDFGSLILMPGLVDTHVHVNEPGRTEWEGFSSATAAAASGGITSLVDMPLNCSPVTTSTSALDQKLATLGAGGAEGHQQLYVDAGFWGGVVPQNQLELRSLAEAGVRGCKAFLIDSGIDEFQHVGEIELRLAMRELERAGVPLIAHAELDNGAAAAGPASDPRTYAAYLASRPEAWELAAIELLVRLCRETGCPVHIVHLSAASALPVLAAARAAGLPITAETCPHYLCLSAEEIEDGQTLFKCAPPIRGSKNRDALWQGLRDGIIDAVVSDHSPCTPALKQAKTGDFMKAWGGIASLSLGLGSVWKEAVSRGFAPEDLARWMSAAPAALAGLGSRKGAIAPGADADFVVWDPDAEYLVGADALLFKHKQSPYVGRAARGRVQETWLRGRVIFDAARPGPAHARLGPPSGRPLLDRR